MRLLHGVDNTQYRQKRRVSSMQQLNLTNAPVVPGGNGRCAAAALVPSIKRASWFG